MTDRPPIRVCAPRLRVFVVLAFLSTRAAIAAEQILRDESIDVKVVSLPRHRGEFCGVALRLSPEDELSAIAALDRHDVEVAARDEIQDYEDAPNG